MSFVKTINVTFHAIDCWHCSALFGMNDSHYQKRVSDHEAFYCPVCGKSQRFVGETSIQKADRLRAEAEARLARERAAHDQTREEVKARERQLIATRGVVTRVKNRVAKGVCPCCNRYFEQLHKHMETQHPDYQSSQS